MADNFTCVVCGKGFKTGSGLSSHMRAKHPDHGVAPEPTPTEQVGVATVVMGGGVSRHEPAETAAAWIAERLELSNGEMLDWACKELAIDPENVMSYRVEEDRVVIIEGPVGYKRTFMLPDPAEV